jgi:hypothetical protein
VSDAKRDHFQHASATPRELRAEVLRLYGEVDRLQEELRRAEGRIEQRYANDQVREMRRTGYCPCCGAEA